MLRCNTAARLSNAPHQAVTKDIIDRIDAALSATGGHRGHAAVILKFDEKRLSNIVLNNPCLRVKWSSRAATPPEPGAADDIERAAGIQPFSRQDLAVVKALESQESLLARGWEQLNFSEAKHSFLLAVQNSHGAHWENVGTMFKGGVVYTSTELLYRFNKIMKQLDDIDEHPEKYDRKMMNQWGEYVTKTAHEHRLELIDRALAISEMFRKLNGDVDRAQLIKAQVERLASGPSEDGKRKKAGWGTAPTVDVTPTTL